MTNDKKQQKLSDSTDTAIAYSTCYAQPFDTVIHSNFLDNNLPDKCANLIIADPPYFEVKGAFDFVYNSFEDYLKDVEKWAIECKRILADNGTLFWYGHAKTIAYAQIIFDKHFNLINNLVWDKGSFMGLEESEGLRSFAPCTERILMYSNETNKRGLEMIFSDANCFINLKSYMDTEKIKANLSNKQINEIIGSSTNGGGLACHYFGFTKDLTKTQFQIPIKEHYEKLQKTGFFTKPYEELRKEYEELRKEYEELRRPFSNHFKLQEILRFSNEATKTGAKYDHDTVKPETLTRALILTCSRENDLVVVPFAGSGTEMAMSIKEGRKAIGYDIEKKYVDMSNKRIKTFKDAPSLF